MAELNSLTDAVVAGPVGPGGEVSRSFEELFAAYGAAVLMLVKNRAPAGADYEGIAQDCWLNISRRLPRFKPASEGSYLAWIRTIARNAAISAGRGARRRKDADAEEIGGETGERLAENLYKELREDPRGDDLRLCQIELALERPDFAYAIRRHYYDGVSQAEIAVETGVAEGTVASRIGRGKQLLRACVERKQAGVEL